VKYPKRIKHRGRVLATICGSCKGRDSYRVAWPVAGQRHMASFAACSPAKRQADGLVKDLAKGSQVTAVHPAQARDAMAAWLESYRAHTDGRLWPENESIFQKNFLKFCEDAEVTRKTNGLRLAFCTCHFAANANENQTVQQAGNSPAMIHAHYKGLATKAGAQKRFVVLPPDAAKNVIPL
jgi:hypothetical protein